MSGNEIKIFTTEDFRETLPEDKFNELVANFTAYKKTGIPPENFGRDTSYDFPFSVKEAGLKHIHM